MAYIHKGINHFKDGCEIEEFLEIYGRRIFVEDSSPPNPKEGDLWIDTS